MNTHKIDYKILDSDYPLLVLFLDAKEESQTLESFAFIKSTESSGLFPILNCTCGEWGCGGFWVQVRHDGDFVIWEKIRIWEKDKDIPRLHVETPIVFKKNDYKKVADKMLQRINSNEKLKKMYEAEKRDYEKTGKFYWSGFSASEPKPEVSSKDHPVEAKNIQGKTSYKKRITGAITVLLLFWVANFFAILKTNGVKDAVTFTIIFTFFSVGFTYFIGKRMRNN